MTLYLLYEDITFHHGGFCITLFHPGHLHRVSPPLLQLRGDVFGYVSWARGPAATQDTVQSECLSVTAEVLEEVWEV